MKPGRTKLILISLIFIGAFIRFWGMGNDGFHTDEAYTFRIAQNTVAYILTFTLTQDCNPPLFYLIDHFSMLVFGATRWAVRFPSAVFGTLLIPATYFLGKEVDGEDLGILSALVVTFLGSMWYYSQFGRAYMLACLLFTMLTFYFLRLARGDTSHWYNWAPFTGLAILLAYTHLFALIPVGLMFLYLIYKNLWQGLQWGGIAVILTSPLLGLFQSILTGRTVGISQLPQPTIPDLLMWTPIEFFGYALTMFGLLLCIGAWQNMKESRLLIGIAGLSFIIELGISTVTAVYPRYTLLLVPMLCCMAMLPLTRLWKDPGPMPAQKWLITGVILGLYFIILIYQAMTTYYLPKGTIFL